MSDRVLNIFDQQRDGIITESSFLANMTRIFVSDLESRMHLTFDM